MRVLVAFASKHGATRGIAERIAECLERSGLEVALEPVDTAPSPIAFDAIVVGSAAYMGRWLKEATSFVRGNRGVLATRPVWLFSSGPVGSEAVDAKGRDVVEAARPLEFAEFAGTIKPRGERVFFGAFDPDAPPIGAMERLGRPFLHMPAIREALPAGDFRDWPEIESWAEGIAEELRGAVVPG